MPKIEIEVDGPSELCWRWNSVHVSIDVIVLNSNFDNDAPELAMESILSGATTKMELKLSIQMQVYTYLEARGSSTGEISHERQLQKEL